MARYISRSGWTSTSASGSRLSGSKLRGVAVHWPGTSQDHIGTSGIANRLRGYRDYHVNTRGWRDIGYNLAISQAGDVYMLRSTSWAGDMVGAHAASGGNPDANEEYVGVLLLLGDRETPSSAMVAAFRDWYHTRFLPAWPGRTDVRGHRQVPGAQTSCPGTRALAAIDDMTAPPQEDTMSAKDVVAGLESSTGFQSPYLRDEVRDGKDSSLRWLTEWAWHYAHGARGNAAAARNAAREARDLAEANAAKLDALMDAQQGLDTDAIKAHIDQRYSQASAERAQLAETVDGLVELVEQVGSGERDAAEVVDEIARRLASSDDDA